MHGESLDVQMQPSINGVTLTSPGEHLSTEELRQRACTELLRQAAQQAGQDGRWN